jgi:hypothetical protein
VGELGAAGFEVLGWAGGRWGEDCDCHCEVLQSSLGRYRKFSVVGDYRRGVRYSVVLLKVEAPMLSLNFRRDGVEMTWGELRIFEYQTYAHTCNVDNSHQRLLVIQVLTYKYTHK